MGHLVCEECKGHYTLKEGESPDDFKSCQCGGKLKYVESLDEKIPISSSRTKPQKKAPHEAPGKMRAWLGKRENKINLAAASIALILGIILILMVSYNMPYDRNLAYIYIYNAQYNSPGQVQVDVDKAATEYIINGKTELNSTITIISSDTEITNQTDSYARTSFQYRVNLPQNISEATVKLKANQTGKEDSYIDIIIRRLT